MKRIVCLLVCLAAASVGAADAATRTVCASGCAYTNLQPAIDAASPGDVILLRAGETFVGNFVLKAKSSASTAFITIRSDAPDSSLPADGVRLIPEGKPGANTARASLARLLGQSGTYKSTPVIRTQPGAHHYRLQFLEVDGSANLGYETLIALGENTSNQTSVSASPYSLVLDRLYIHGDARRGMKRGVALNSRSSDVLNSYISDFKSLSDSQGIAGFNGAGPFRIINNYIEAAAENILFGGADPKTPNLVPGDIEIRGNHLYKPMAWENPVLQPPSRVTTSASTSGSLAAGTHYFKVVAVMDAGGASVVSAPSTEAAVTVGAGGSVTLSWSAVSGADSYRVYRGSSSNGESVYLKSSSTSLKYTGSGESSGTPKTSGTRWTAKNLIELKNAQRVTIDGNVMENNWMGFQNGYAMVLTPRNQSNTAPWSVVRDVTITHNTVRNVPAGFTILGSDDIHPSQQTRNLTIANNLFYDMGGSLGNGRFITITEAPSGIVVDHNTILNDSTIVMVDGPPVSGFVYTNNLSRHNTYGIDGQKTATGTATLDKFFPGWVFKGNVLAGGKASVYPAGNYFPTVAAFEASFVGFAVDNYALVAGSPFVGAGTDGRDIGAPMTTVFAARVSAESGSADGGGLTDGVGSTDGGGSTDDGGGSTGGGTDTTTDVLPSGWQSQDVGAVGLAGSASESGGVFSLTGAGADIWDTADAFQFAYRTLTGDGTIVARVSSVSGTQAWTKVGVMIRGSAEPGAAHALMLVSKGKGIAFQRRTKAGGSSESSTSVPGVAPQWVRLQRAGTTVTASFSDDGTSWTTAGSATIALPADALVGLVVSSHTATALASGTFDHVAVAAGEALPAGWESTDIGAVGLTGSASSSGGTFTVKGAGDDVWGTQDAAQFVWRTLEGDGDIVARVATVSGTQAWTKAGVMMRMTLDPGSPQAFMLVSKGKGLAFQRRTVSGGQSLNTSGGAGTAPKWVKLSRAGSVITASVSNDGAKWTVVGSDTFSIAGPLQVGLAVSSHDRDVLATATFDNVR